MGADTIVEAVPFTDETMTRDDMLEHIEKVHGYDIRNSYQFTSKVTKAQMQTWHEDQHKGLEIAKENGWDLSPDGDHWSLTPEQRQTLVAAGVRTIPIKPRVEHIHTEVPVPDTVTEAAKKIGKGSVSNTPVASLNASERKALKELVDNDFEMLKQEMAQMASDMAANAVAEVEAEWATRREAWKDFRHKAQRLLDKQDKARRALIREAEEAGVRLRLMDGYGRAAIEAEVKGYEEALIAARAAAKAQLDRALLTLERQRLSAQREVLLTGVTKEAAVVLDAIPDAKTLMVEAAAAASSKQIEA